MRNSKYSKFSALPDARRCRLLNSGQSRQYVAGACLQKSMVSSAGLRMEETCPSVAVESRRGLQDVAGEVWLRAVAQVFPIVKQFEAVGLVDARRECGAAYCPGKIVVE